MCMQNDQEELKARIEAAKDDLSFFSLNMDEILKTGWMTKEELEESVNDALDDMIDAQRKLKEKGGSP